MEVVIVVVCWLIVATIFGFLIGSCISFGVGDNEGGIEENVEG